MSNDRFEDLIRRAREEYNPPPEVPREAIWAAFKKRHLYATSGPRIILNFWINGFHMGSDANWPADRGAIPLGFRVIGCDEIERVEIIRNGETVFSEPVAGNHTRNQLVDPNPVPGTSWYYLRVLQKDGNMAKKYQVRQVRNIILQYNLGSRES